MNIVVNGKDRTVSAHTLEEMLLELGYGTTRVATAHRGEFVPARLRGGCMLQEGDAVEVLAPMQGG